MVSSVSPLSSEPIVDVNGFPTRRFFAWISENTTGVNESRVFVELAPSIIDNSTTILSTTNNIIKEAEVFGQLGTSAQDQSITAELVQKNNVLEPPNVIALIANLQKQIDDLKLGVI